MIIRASFWRPSGAAGVAQCKGSGPWSAGSVRGKGQRCRVPPMPVGSGATQALQMSRTLSVHCVVLHPGIVL